MAGLADGWLSPGMRVLEIGCGLGHTGAWLARHGIEATAFDFAPEVIERARKLYPSEERLTLLVADACGPSPFSTTFDVILDTGCFHGIARSLHPRYRKNALAWSRPGTRFVMSMHTANVPAEERIEVVRELLCPPLEIVGEGRRPSFDGQRLNVILHLVRS
jgi:cyclopropane fatty-acyl-phospholipid synthase-like methyltransferase